MNDTAIDVRGLRKKYGPTVAVDGVTFEVCRGEIFGLLGPNGAGKTTTLESLEGIRRPDGGTLRILGVDPAREPGRLRQLIGVQLQTSPGASPLPAVAKQFVKEDYAVFFSTDPGPTVSAILARIAACGDRLVDLRVERPSLEERFLELTETGGAR